MEEHSAIRIGQVTVEVGMLAGIDGSSLEFCFDAITKGTPLEKAHLKIEEVKPRARCRNCGHEYEVSLADFRCKACGSSGFQMLGGSEISVKQVEVE
jgi:hydrogenase nickel incorporation protein HypA/HybF